MAVRILVAVELESRYRIAAVRCVVQSVVVEQSVDHAEEKVEVRLPTGCYRSGSCGEIGLRSHSTATARLKPWRLYTPTSRSNKTIGGSTQATSHRSLEAKRRDCVLLLPIVV